MGFAVELVLSIALIYVFSIVHEYVHYVTARLLGYRAVVVLKGRFFLSTSVDIAEDDRNLVWILLAPLVLVPVSYYGLMWLSWRVAVIVSLSLLGGSCMDVLMAVLVLLDKPGVIKWLNRVLMRIDGVKYLLVTRSAVTDYFVLSYGRSREELERLVPRFEKKLNSDVMIVEFNGDGAPAG
jgi:hypothetical protein